MIYVALLMALLYVAVYYATTAFTRRRHPAAPATEPAGGLRLQPGLPHRVLRAPFTGDDLDAAERHLTLRLLRGTIDPAAYRSHQATIAALEAARRPALAPVPPAAPEPPDDLWWPYLRL